MYASQFESAKNCSFLKMSVNSWRALADYTKKDKQAMQGIQAEGEAKAPIKETGVHQQRV
jgi:hypothetical protein